MRDLDGAKEDGVYNLGGVLKENITSRLYFGREIVLHFWRSYILDILYYTYSQLCTINKRARQYEWFIRNQTCHVFQPTISSIHDFGIRTVPVYVLKSKI